MGLVFLNKKFKTTSLDLKIETLREHMVHLAQKKGLSHPDTIKCSQELDHILNEHNKLKCT